ncbi:WXG100 family type VII secretion target [Candidatus Chloroploca sp. M-50]|uniref:WXG100 family type VII secretion target n=1 Tax=Candidatus Chloroploca mongolica TaxID=2528176 RepID=A0ABS4DFK7_9CHLR|nr:WXG100 family type VII secretion target [Candidatus Chloroploca mongolica]MBP1468231.1 WXG100 family type VII secretion target [Candidatus Chloroploca mongolica]
MSSQLRVDTDLLRATAQQFQRSNQTLAAEVARAEQAMLAMQQSLWRGRHRSAAEAVWDALRVHINPTHDNLTTMVSRLERAANAYDEAARVFGQGSGFGTGAVTQAWPNGLAPSVITGLIGLGIQVGKGFLEIRDGLGTIQALNALKKLDFSKGTTYAKQIVVRGPHDAKIAGFLKPNLTHFKATFGAYAKQVFKGAGDVTKGAAILTAITSGAENGFNNWQTYKDDSQAVQKTVVATTIDTAVETGFVAGGTYVGATLGGAALGTALGAVSGGVAAPLGIALGTHVGGMIGGLAGGWAADVFMGTDFYKDNRESAVTGGANMIDSVGKAVGDAAQSAGQHLQQAGESLAQATQQAAQQVESAVNEAIGGLVNMFRW